MEDKKKSQRKPGKGGKSLLTEVKLRATPAQIATWTAAADRSRLPDRNKWICARLDAAAQKCAR